MDVFLCLQDVILWMPESKENASRKSVREQEERERKWQEGGISICLNTIGELGRLGGQEQQPVLKERAG